MCRSTSTLSLLVWIDFFPKCWITVTVGFAYTILQLVQKDVRFLGFESFLWEKKLKRYSSYCRNLQRSRAHGDVTHGGLGGFVSCPYFFPQYCMPYRLSVGSGLFTNHFWLAINTHEREWTFGYFFQTDPHHQETSKQHKDDDEDKEGWWYGTVGCSDVRS